MMMKKIKGIYCVVALGVLSACGSGDDAGAFSDPSAIAIDVANDRLFITQARGEILVLSASDFAEIGDQPAVSGDENVEISDDLPDVASGLAVFSTGDTSRLFILGAIPEGDNGLMLNSIRVLDFDGDAFEFASFSPINLSDNDSTTTETDNSFAAILVDQDNTRFYVTDATAGKLYVMSATDGTQILAPLDIAGDPQGMALTDGRLYVCNSSNVAAEQVITVVKVSDFTTTTIDVDMPCDHIAAMANDSGVVLLINHYLDQEVLIRSVNTTTFADTTAIASDDSESYDDGVLNTGSGISSVIAALTLARGSDDRIFGYLSEQDGNLQHVIIDADLSEYALETLSTAAVNVSSGVVFTSGAVGEIAYFIAGAGSVLATEVGSDEVDLHL